MRRLRTTRLLPLLCLLLLQPPAAAAARAPGGELTVADYCELTRALLELSAREWQERVDAAAQKKGDRKEMLRTLERVAKSYRAQQDEVYGRFGMSAREDLRYASDHQSEIESYLEENPEVRDSIESLKARIDALIEQFESAAAGPTEGARR